MTPYQAGCKSEVSPQHPILTVARAGRPEEVSITKRMWMARAKWAAKGKQDASSHDLAPRVKRHLCYGASPAPTSTEGHWGVALV